MPNTFMVGQYVSTITIILATDIERHVWYKHNLKYLCLDHFFMLNSLNCLMSVSTFFWAVTVLPTTLKTLSDLMLATGTAKTILTI